MNASDREIGNFGIAVAIVALIGLVAIVLAGTDRLVQGLIAAFLALTLLWLSAILRLRAATPAQREDVAQIGITIGGFGSLGSLAIAATGTGHWDAIGLIAFLGFTLVAVAGAALGWLSPGGHSRGESA